MSHREITTLLQKDVDAQAVLDAPAHFAQLGVLADRSRLPHQQLTVQGWIAERKHATKANLQPDVSVSVKRAL